MKTERILRIKEACKEAGKKQKDLSRVLGINETTLSTAISEDRFSAKDLVKIADELGVPLQDLFEARSRFVALVREGRNTYAFDSEGELRDWLEKRDSGSGVGSVE